jgi:thymidylate kinase
VRRLPQRALRRPRGAVIALSGLDGAGKSTQALALRDTLELLGHETTIAWTRIIWDDALWRAALPVKGALTRSLQALAVARSRLSPRRHAALRTSAGAESAEPEDRVKRIREGSALLTHAWTMVIALVNGCSERRLTQRHLRRGAIVICDRYTLDSIVALRFSYGPHRRFRAQRALIAALAPTPQRAYLLDVRPETAYERKGEGGVEWLDAHRRLYREEHVELGVRLLDGERRPDDLCAEIALDVWQSRL